MAQTKAERRAAIVARARANPNSSDKGTAGAKAVDAVRKKVRTKKLANGATGKTKGASTGLSKAGDALSGKTTANKIKSLGL